MKPGGKLATIYLNWLPSQDRIVRCDASITVGIARVRIEATLDFVCYYDQESQAAKIVIDEEQTVIVKVGETAISDMQDYMAALGTLKLGATVQVTVERGDAAKRHTYDVVVGSR